MSRRSWYSIFTRGMFAVENQLPSCARVSRWWTHWPSTRRADVAAPEVVAPVRHREGNRRAARVDLIIRVVGRIEALVVVLPMGAEAPSAAQGEEPLVVDAALERAAEIEEIAIAPGRVDENECGGILQRRSRLPVPGEPVGESALDDVDAVHEPAQRRKVGTDADQLGMIAVGVASAVVERQVPQRARPHAGAGRVLRPGTHDLRVGEPDLLPDESHVRAQHPIPGAADA